jgi:hypothetical protein
MNGSLTHNERKQRAVTRAASVSERHTRPVSCRFPRGKHAARLGVDRLPADCLLLNGCLVRSHL